MTADEAIAFVRQHGIVLVSAKGAAPRLTEAIVGAPIKGSWWGHPRGREVFAILRAVAECEDILTCRLLDGKLTLVHRRLWPALVRIAGRFPASRIAQVREVHTASGRHERIEISFPDWVPAEVTAQAEDLSKERALAALGRYATKLYRFNTIE